MMFAPDMALMTWLAGHRIPWVTKLAELLSAASSSLPVIGGLLLLALIWVVLRRRWSVAFVVGSSAVVAVVLTGVLKVLIGRDRPPAGLALVHAQGFSMPSTDGALTAAVALALFLLAGRSAQDARRVWGAALGVGVVLIGGCLVYLGAHWPSDVLAGWVVGAITAGTCYRLQRWVSRTGRRRDQAAGTGP